MLVKWRAPREMNTFDTSFDRMVNEVFGNFADFSPVAEKWAPRVDISENNDAFTAKIDLPGVAKEDLSINVEDNVLTIKGERKAEEKQEGVNYHRVERSYGTFERSFKLGDTIMTDKIAAEYTNGVLTVVLPKAEKAKPRQIEVKVS